MSPEPYRVLGLAPARSGWFREVSRWSTSAALPIEFVKCVSLDELAARLGTGRVFSAMLIDAAVAGLDRDLIDAAHEVGASVLVVDDGYSRRDWAALGSDIVLPATFDRSMLLVSLAQTTRPVQRPRTGPESTEPVAAAGWRGRLIAVTGPGGGGSSTAAMALAQGLASDLVSRGRDAGSVILADCALHADLALLHDAGDIVPGLQELAEAHRGGLPEPDEVRGMSFISQDRGYHLLLGLRRHRDWTTLRPRAVQATIDSLLRAFEMVVADVDADVEGDDEVGSVDVEERNLLARTVTARADLVLVVATPTISGLKRMATTLDELSRFGIGPDRLQPVLTRGPRRGRARAGLTAALAELTRGIATDGTQIASPVFLPERGNLDHLHMIGTPLPRGLVEPVAGAVLARLDRSPVVAAGIDAFSPVVVAAGSLGAWSDERESAG